MLRGNRLTIEGDDAHVAEGRAVVDELVELVEGGHEIGPSTVDAVLGALDQAEDIREVFEDVVWRHRGKKIAPKTVQQKRYVDAIRAHTVTFAIGPAGTGKTYLAMALAVAALSDRQVGRIILTRDQGSGLIQVQDILGTIDGISFIQFTHKDVVRHKLVQRIVEAYRQYAEETGTQRLR